MQSLLGLPPYKRAHAMAIHVPRNRGTILEAFTLSYMPFLGFLLCQIDKSQAQSVASKLDVPRYISRIPDADSPLAE